MNKLIYISVIVMLFSTIGNAAEDKNYSDEFVIGLLYGSVLTMVDFSKVLGGEDAAYEFYLDKTKIINDIINESGINMPLLPMNKINGKIPSMNYIFSNI